MNSSPRIFFVLFFLLISLMIGYAWISNTAINWVGLIAVCGFYLIIFSIGIWSSKKISTIESDSFLLAGRKLPLWIGVLTMAATWLGGGYINGTAEAAYAYGLIWVQAPWGYGLSLIIGGIFFARKMRRHRFKTMLEPFTIRYGKRTTGLFFVPAVLGEIFWIAAILTALGTTFSVIIGLDTQVSIIISALIAILYTVIGGLWSVAFTDVVQIILLAIGLFITIPFLTNQIGSFSELWEQYQFKFGLEASLIPNPRALGDSFWNWIDLYLLLIFGGIPWQVYFQRVLASKNEQTAMWLSILAGIICIIIAFPATYIGMVGAITDWSILNLSGPADAASILPYTYQHLTPNIVAIIGLAAISAAVMSSIDSSILSASSLTIVNVYKPLLQPKRKPPSTQRLIQRAIIIIGCTATFLSLKVTSIYDLWYLCSDLVYCLLFPGLVVTLFDPKANTPGVVSGFIVAAILRLGGGEPTLGLPSWIPYPASDSGLIMVPFRTIAMIAGLFTMLIASRLTQHIIPARNLINPNKKAV